MHLVLMVLLVMQVMLGRVTALRARVAGCVIVTTASRIVAVEHVVRRAASTGARRRHVSSFMR